VCVFMSHHGKDEHGKGEHEVAELSIQVSILGEGGGRLHALLKQVKTASRLTLRAERPMFSPASPGTRPIASPTH
jgi:hypothetical protein